MGCFYVFGICLCSCVMFNSLVGVVCNLWCAVVWCVFVCVCSRVHLFVCFICELSCNVVVFVCVCVCWCVLVCVLVCAFPNEPVRWDAPLKSQRPNKYV